MVQNSHLTPEKLFSFAYYCSFMTKTMTTVTTNSMLISEIRKESMRVHKIILF